MSKILIIIVTLFVLFGVWLTTTFPVVVRPSAGNTVGGLALKDDVCQQRQPSPRVGRWVSEVFEVTAYCACEKCCGTGSPGITASGNRVDGPVRHWLAADARFPFGTCFRVPGYAQGAVICVLDRGGAIKGNKIDLYMDSHQAALNWGRKTLAVDRWEQK